MGSVCSCFDGLSSKRSAHASVLASPAKWGSGGQQAPSGTAAALAADGLPLKPDRSPARATGSEATEEPVSALSEPPSSDVPRETTEEQDVRLNWMRGEFGDQVQQWRASSDSTSAPDLAYAGLPTLGVLAGTWRYHETACYQLSALSGGQWRFDERHDSGRTVSGILEPRGAWLKGALSYNDTSEECGTIRLRFGFIHDQGVICSNFRPSGANWWSGDMFARQDKRISSIEEESEQKDDEADEEREGLQELTTRGSSASSAGPRKFGSKKQGLDMIPTRVKAKLERSIQKTRRRPNSMFSEGTISSRQNSRSSRQHSRQNSREGTEQGSSLASARRTLRGPSRWSQPSEGVSCAGGGSGTFATEASLQITSGGRGGSMASQKSGVPPREPCCTQLFPDCCRNTSTRGSELSELSVEGRE